MARDFTKNTANYMSCGTSQIGPLVDGAAKISTHLWANFDSLETTNVTNDRLLVILVDGAATGIAIASNAPSGTPVMRVQCRSVGTDTAQNIQGTTPLVTGSWLSLGASIDFAADSVTPYYEGVSEGSTGVAFANNTFTLGTPTGADTIGGAGAPPSSTANQVDGRIAEVAIWNDDIGAAGFAALASGVSPLSIRRDALVFYMRLLGDDSPETSVVSSVTGTITGSLPQAAHPVIYTLTGPSLFRGRGFSFFDDEEVNRFEFWPAIESSGEITLTIQNASHAHTAQNLDLTQDHNLTIQNTSHGHTAENIVLTQDHSLAIANGAHSHTAENLILTQNHVLAVQNGTHGHSAENLIITQDHGLVIQGAIHGHTAENLSLTQTHELAIQGGNHPHSAESPNLTQDHILSIQNGFHGHTADNVNLDGSANLTIQNTVHGHSADSLVLTQTHVLAVQNADHSHSAQSLTLMQTHELAVQDSSHAHAADALTLTQTHELGVQNAVHGHTAEALSLTQNHNLTIQGGDHAHVAENLALLQSHVLSISAGNHAHSAENATLTQTHVLTIQSGLHAHTAENVSFGTKNRTIITHTIATIRSTSTNKTSVSTSSRSAEISRR